jgi:hypothetical protein
LLLVELTEVVLDPAEAVVDDRRGCEEEEGEGEAVRSLSSFLSLDLDESELDLALESCCVTSMMGQDDGEFGVYDVMLMFTEGSRREEQGDQ